MVEVDFAVDKNLNFLMILHQKIKNQNNFEHLEFKNIENLSKDDKKGIKEIIRTGRPFEESIKKNPKFGKIYEENIKSWNKYWESNLDSLLKIKDSLKLKWKEYIAKSDSNNVDILKRIGNYFDFKGPEKIICYICMGSETELGTGNAFSPNIAVVFPRDFKKCDNKNIEFDFGVLIHELFHLNQDMCNEKDKEVTEQIARCFAPKGILYNEEKNKENPEIYNLVKNSFNNNESYKEIKDKINEINNQTKDQVN